MKLTPSGAENHIFPSGDLATSRLWPPVRARLLTPSELSKTVVWTLRFESLTQASNSERPIRTRPQAMYNQKECSLSSITELTASQGRPFLLVSVATVPFFTRLKPPSVAAHSAPSEPVEGRSLGHCPDHLRHCRMSGSDRP